MSRPACGGQAEAATHKTHKTRSLQMNRNLFWCIVGLQFAATSNNLANQTADKCHQRFHDYCFT
jgi:hypothetical protein